MKLVIREAQNIIDAAISIYRESWPQAMIKLLSQNDINLYEDLDTGQVLVTEDFEIDPAQIIGDQGFRQHLEEAPTTVTVGEKQNTVDVAVSEYGSRWADGLINLVANNELNLSEDVAPRQVLRLRGVEVNDFIRRSYKAAGYKVSTKDKTNYLLVPEGDYILTPEGGRIIFE